MYLITENGRKKWKYLYIKCIYTVNIITELVTFKMEHDFLEDVDKTARSAGFQNRTEFIRTALREKVEEVKLKEAMLALSKFRGKAPKKTTDEERRRTREQVSKELMAELDRRFSQ